MFRLFFDGYRLAVAVKFHNAESLRIVHIIPENSGSLAFLGIPNRRPQALIEAMPRKNVVAQHHRNRIAADEILTDDERLRQAVRRRLNGIRQIHAELPSVSQQALKARRILRRRNNQNIPNARVHQHRHRIVNHRLIVNREQLFARHLGQRIQARAGTARQNNSLHHAFPFFIRLVGQTFFSSSPNDYTSNTEQIPPFFP